MHVEDAVIFIVNCIAKPRPASPYSSYGYEVYVPNIIAAYLTEAEPGSARSTVRDSPRARELMPTFSEAAWDLCRRGILRPLLVAVLGLAVAVGWRSEFGRRARGQIPEQKEGATAVGNHLAKGDCNRYGRH
jgi:hypothetical protein